MKGDTLSRRGFFGVLAGAVVVKPAAPDVLTIDQAREMFAAPPPMMAHWDEVPLLDERVVRTVICPAGRLTTITTVDMFGRYRTRPATIDEADSYKVSWDAD